MSADKCFFDTNVLLYLLSENAEKADRAETIVAVGGTISVQVLNEFAAVARRKLSLSHSEIREVLDPIRTLCRVEPLTPHTHDLAMQMAERYRVSIYDALIIAAALLADCTTLYSEDLQDRQVFADTLRIHNPFVR